MSPALLGGRFVVVDVRRARERILYEDYLKMLGSGSSVSQQLLFPERLVLSDSEYALLEENAVEFASLGFDLDFQGDCAVEVKGHAGQTCLPTRWTSCFTNCCRPSRRPCRWPTCGARRSPP